MKGEKILIKDLSDGTYYPILKHLSFRLDTDNELLIDYKSAAQIAYSLFDAVGALDKNMEVVFFDIFEKVELKTKEIDDENK